MCGALIWKIPQDKRLATTRTFLLMNVPELNGIGSLATNTNSSQPGVFFESF
jgi:hypothetical protein